MADNENRVVQGRMVTPKSLAELIEDDSVMDAESIEDADRECPECGGSVLMVGYMPSVMEFVTGYKCQDCDWKAMERE
jgi:ribosomal protein S27AE